MEKLCSEPNCPNKLLCRGLCSMHYQRLRHHGNSSIKLTGTKDDPCSKCKINKRRDTHSWCQPCLNESSRKSYSKMGKRYFRYGLTEEDLYCMWLYQGGRCDICKDPIELNTCHVDHDNSCCSKEITRVRRCCGKCVRALLCSLCNQGLGNFKDSSYRLLEAIKYLERTK